MSTKFMAWFREWLSSRSLRAAQRRADYAALRRDACNLPLGWVMARAFSLGDKRRTDARR